MQKVSRRNLLRRSIAGAVGLGIVGTPLKNWATTFTPALIIGSGFGGAVAALRLAQSGVDTIVLERGRHWPIRPDGNTFATFENPDGRCAWLSRTTPLAALESQFGLKPATFDPFTGIMELIQGNGITILAGAGVGGGSLHYNGVLVEPHRSVFEQIFPRQISFEEMEGIYYPRVRSVINPSIIPPDILATDFYLGTRVTLEQAQAAGFNTRSVSIGVDWEVVRQEIAGTRVPSIIAGQSWYGINSGAKQSVDRNYLAMAEATERAKVLPLHEVVRIEKLGSGRDLYSVSANEINEHGELLRSHRFVCRHLFLAAGSIGTTKLLLRAKAIDALPGLNDQVGQNWAANGDFTVLRVGLPPNNPGTGGPVGHFIMEDYRPQEVDLSDPTRLPPNGLIEAVMPPHFARQIKDVLGLGYSSIYIGMGIHPPIGALTYDPETEEVTVNFPMTDPALKPFLASSQNMLKILNERNTNNFTPSTLLYAPNLASHPLGGAAVGAVCDLFGRVLNYPGLYVVDGAFVPGFAGAVNPSLTIAALAERNVERILDEDIVG